MKKIYFHEYSPEELQDMIEKIIDKKIAQLNLAKPAEEDRLFTLAETVERLSCSLVTLNRWRREGKIESHKLGSRVYIRQSALNKALQKVRTIPVKKTEGAK